MSLDFSKVKAESLKKLDSRCSRVTKHQFHIYTKWANKRASSSFQQYSVGITGNHFDPTYACSSGSQYTNTKWCPTKVYKCTPGATKSCEVGDLSGRLSALKPSGNKQRVSWSKFDGLFPSQADIEGKSIVLHAVCGSTTVRLACAGAAKAAH